MPTPKIISMRLHFEHTFSSLTHVWSFALHLFFQPTLQHGMNSMKMRGYRAAQPSLKSIAMRFRVVIVSASLCVAMCLSVGVLAQSSVQGAVSQGVWEVDWLPKGTESAPVGIWAPMDGFWLDEIPWVLWEAELNGFEAGMERLVDTESWAEVPADELTPRQRQLLMTKTIIPQWRHVVIEDLVSVQYESPLFRFVASRDVFERLMGVEWAVGASVATIDRQEREREWPTDGPLERDNLYRLSIAQDGVYRIDRNWMVAAGLNPDTLDPRRIRLWGNGGELLPMENDQDRPLGVEPTAILFQGEEDGVWNAEDALLFFGQGPNSWIPGSAERNWKHERHAYSDSAWYFLEINGDIANAESRIQSALPTGGTPDTLIDTYWKRSFHELELESPNRSGREWFGESFQNNSSRVVSFDVPFATASPARLDIQVAAQSMGAASTFKFDVNGVLFEASPSYTSNGSVSNVANLSSGSFDLGSATGTDLTAQHQVEISFDPAVPDAIGWLDFIRIAQECSLRMAQSQLIFDAENIGEVAVAGYAVQNSGSLVGIWDITEHKQPVWLTWESSEEGEAVFYSQANEAKRFALFSGFNFKTPDFHGAVQPVNLHGVEQADLVVVTRSDYLPAAERLAQLHAAEGLSVLVTTQRAVFDAFSCGNTDPTALKMLLMMLRDRASQNGLEPPKYLQIMGDGTFANRLNLMQSPYVITYQSENSVSPTGSYVSDDFFGFLEEQYGEGIGDKMAIGVGRIPCSSAAEADAMVDKVEAYMQRSVPVLPGLDCEDASASASGAWKNVICFVADDMDGNGGPTENEHMVNSDEHANTLAEDHPEYDVNKIYLDAYPQWSTPGGERYPEAEESIDRQVQDGALIMNYIGHGGERGWSHERVLNTTTIQEWDKLGNMPLFMTATCELARFDDPDVDSAGEMMVMNPAGGAIAMLTTTRVVFSGSNQQLNRAFYGIALHDTESEPLRLGDIARVTKNDPQVSNSSNKRNFTLLGDVALRLNYPRKNVVMESLPDTIRALDVVSVGGTVRDEAGDLMPDFDGLVYVKVFDKPSQITSLNNDNGPNSHVFEVFRNVLHQGIASVDSGAFAFEFVVPRDIDFSFAEGRISCYAVSDSTDAHGSYQDFVIGGIGEGFLEDTTPPTVELFLNDTLFQSGGITHSHPMLLARVFDEGGINAAGVGIGHDIKATLDGESSESIVLNGFYTADLNTYVRGTVRYPFEELEAGPHQLELVVWDVQNNKGKAEITFEVFDDFESALGHVSAYPNPSADVFRFSLEHNQACQPGVATLEVFSSAGQLVYRSEQPWEQEGFRSESLQWNSAAGPDGSAVPAGVYVFRLTLNTETGGVVQYADQIVVLRP
jgi:hypothetical protein